MVHSWGRDECQLDAGRVLLVPGGYHDQRSMSTLKGLHSNDGQLFMRSIGLRKLLRPKLILIEQVAGFHSLIRTGCG